MDGFRHWFQLMVRHFKFILKTLEKTLEFFRPEILETLEKTLEKKRSDLDHKISQLLTSKMFSITAVVGLPARLRRPCEKREVSSMLVGNRVSPGSCDPSKLCPINL